MTSPHGSADSAMRCFGLADGQAAADNHHAPRLGQACAFARDHRHLLPGKIQLVRLTDMACEAKVRRLGMELFALGGPRQPPDRVAIVVGEQVIDEP